MVKLKYDLTFLTFPIFLIRIISFEFSAGKPDIATIPWWVFINYDISHSFVSALVCISIVKRYNK